MKYEKYSRVFGAKASLHDVYVGSNFSDLPESLFKGQKHVCVFYGQTGSGKTYNLLGENNYDLEKSITTTDKLDNPQDTRGLIVRMVKGLFAKINKACGGDKDKEENYRVTVNYYDIHLDKIRDIGKYINEYLTDSITNDLHSITQDQLERQFINIHEKPDGSVVLKNLTNIEVNSPKDMAYIIDKGLESQEVINKRLNVTSSTVHTIVALTFRNDEKKRVGKIYCVDLAGSEWNSKNVSESQRIQESIIINNSFNTLSRIVNLLRARKAAEEKNEPPPKVQLSYHDSKLTRILQNALTLEYSLAVFATVYPTDVNFNESISTLRFMDRIRGISSSASQRCLFSPKLMGDDDEEPSKSDIMLNKLTMENLELKGVIENQKVSP